MTQLITLVSHVPALVQRVREAEGAFAKATENAYGSDWRIFHAWCVAQGLPFLPAAPESVAAFLRAESASGRAVATVKRRAASIAKLHKWSDFPNPCANESVRLALRAVANAAKDAKIEQKQAPGLDQRVANKIAHIMDAPETVKDRRDLALMLCGRDLMARVSELTSLTVADVEFQEDQEDETAIATMWRGKTSKESQKLLLGSEATEALRAWLAAAGIKEGPIFVSVRKGGRVMYGQRMRRQDVGPAIRSLAQKAKIATEFTAHSLRVGMAQDLVSANVEAPAIMQVAGWKSSAMLMRYSKKLQAKVGAIAQYHAKRK